MESEIISEGKKIYDLAVEAGLITGHTFNEFLPESEIKAILEKLETDKKIFLATSQDLKNAQSLWTKGFKNKIVDKLVWILIDFAVEHGKGISLDWKFSADDTIFNVKQVLPDLDVKSLGEKEISGIWYEEIMIDGKVVRVEQQNYMIHEVMKLINRYLADKGKIFITSDRGGDVSDYLLVSRDSALAFENYGFFSV